MATITPTKPRKARTLVPTSDGTVVGEAGAFRAQATAWLAHPLASGALVAVPAALLLMLGTIMVWSASSVYATTQFGDSYYFIKRQLVFLAVGVLAVLVVSRFPLDLLRKLGWLTFGAAGLLMSLTFTPLGYGVKGNKNWLSFSSESMIRLQPSEIAKVAIILWGASLFTAKRKTLGDIRHLLIPFLPGSVLMIGLTALQHDLGTSIIMGLIVIAMLWNVGASLKLLGGFVASAALGVFVMVQLEPFRMERITGFLDPSFEPAGINYQPNQAQFGLATGGWWGVGLGASRQKWGSLSEAHTDYVLAIIGEELGLVGTLAVVALFVILAYGGFRIALRSTSFYARLVAAGLSSWIAIQALVNVFVVLRMLPVLGVPLPLVSYGGSSLVMNMAAIGLLLRCAAEEPEAKAFLARRKKSQSPRGRLSAVLGGRRRRA